MGASDAAATGVPIAELDDAARKRRFAAVVVDEPHDAALLAPLFARSTTTRVDARCDVIGTRPPTWWLVPR